MRMMARPGGPDLVATLTANVVNGYYSDELCDVMGTGRSRSGPRSLPIEQILLIGLAHVEICSGQIIRTMVRADGEPHADSGRHANALALSDLPHPFTAQVDLTQYNCDSDGTMSWAEPIEASSYTADQDDHRAGLQEIVVADPRSVPLEIGSTLPSRTLMHLREARGVARWPYGTDWIHVWLAVGPDHRTFPSLSSVMEAVGR
jgi:hypothetical protein